uniref:Uncharacterized protein n=1 Tax=Cajanus cajan TaxID=3821 RepID=A0A151TWU8_CAJCA|nr:hypothetical protein KK1_010788 [Cajanus cajan]
MQLGIPLRLSVEAVTTLLSPVMKKEVRRTVMSMKSFKALGPNGFQPFFLKKYLHIIKDEV